MSHARNTTRALSPARTRGAAMILVLLALTVATILAGAFLASSRTSTSVARNIDRHAAARSVAESGLTLAVEYVRNTPDWREKQASGSWLSPVIYGAGQFEIMFEDPDGDLNDDVSDSFTITARASVDGYTHNVRAILQPGIDVERTVLMVVPDAGSLSSQDLIRQETIEGWGFVVSLISETADSSEFAAAAAECDVAYIPEDCYSSRIDDKLTTVGIGVVNEEPAMLDELKLCQSAGGTHSLPTINVVDNSHYITEHLPLGVATIATRNTDMAYADDDLASGAQVLARRDGAVQATLIALDAGSPVWNGGFAAGRRVMLPWGGNSFDFGDLNGNGREILRRALTWAGTTTAVPDPVLHYDFAEQEGSRARDRVGDVDLTLHEGNGSIDWVDDPVGGYGIEFSQDAVWGSAIAQTDSASDTEALQEDLQTSGAFTLQLFVRAESFHFLGGRMFSWSPDTEPWRRNITLSATSYSGSSASLYGVVGAGHLLDIEAERDAFETQQYHVLTFTVDTSTSTQNARLYVNGELVKTGSASGTFDDWQTHPIMLGNEATRNRPFAGRIFDVKLWDRPLSDTQVRDQAAALLGNGGDGDDAVPQLIALYEFEPVYVEPDLVGHWPLDDAPGGGGAAVHDEVDMRNGATIDGYDSSLGAYGGVNSGMATIVASNSTLPHRIDLDTHSTIVGDVYVGPSGDVDRTIELTNGATITGLKRVLPAEQAVSIPSPPSGLSGSKDRKTFDGGSHVISSDQNYKTLDLRNRASVEIRGNVRIHVEQKMTIDGSAITVANGGSLTLWVGHDLELRNSGATLNPDTASPGKVAVYVYGNNRRLDVKAGAMACGSFHVDGPVSIPNSNSAIYGRVETGDGISIDGGALHADLALPGAGPGVVDDDAAGNDGTYIGAAAGQDGQVGSAAYFDGVDDYVLVPHRDAYLLDSGSLAFWFQTTNVSRKQAMFSKDSMGYDSGGHLRVFLENGNLRARLQSTSYSHYLETSGVQNGRWHHVVVAWGSSGYRLYLDGELKASDEYTGGLGASSGGSGNTNPIVIGADSQRADDGSHLPLESFFQGYIDDVRLYDQGFDADQAEAVFAGGEPGAGVGSAAVVRDTSGYGDPLDLTISDPGNVRWLSGGGLEVVDDVTIASPGAASKLYDRLSTTDAFTLEAIFTPENVWQDGPARIASYSANTSSRNFTLGQDDARWVARVRTPSTTSNGTPDLVASRDVFEAGEREHVIMTFDGEVLKIYRNGVLEATDSRPGDLDDWDDTMRFMLANELTNNRPWLGMLHRIAIYDRAANALQAEQIFNGEAPTETEEDLTFSIVWDENP